MKRVKKHRIKREIPESSQIRNEEHDLAYYIHDRVELMHQVFSVLKHKELRAMAPECIRHISLDDLQELCTEELLGISSKRLCAILDGADPPSNTESSSSSPERFETISLDSISSDEEILSQGSSKKNKKHKHHRHSKSKHKDRHKESQKPDEDENNKASRAGLTVLELLELQARARAIRAQLQQHQALVPAEQTENQASSSSDDDEVVIKEEAPEVVEISSEDEKPSAQELQRIVESAKAKDTPVEENTNTVTKRINDLIITVPQTKATRKIKLNRPKLTKKDDIVSKEKVTEPPKTVSLPTGKDIAKDKKKKKQKKKDKKKDGSDHDEITLQLSDSEKMDLLEDFDRNRTSSEDSESSSETSQSSSMCNDKYSKKTNKTTNSSHLNMKAPRSQSIENDATILDQSKTMEEAKEIPEKDKRSEDKSKTTRENKSETEVSESCEDDSMAVEEPEITFVNQEKEAVAGVSGNENIENVSTEIEKEILDKINAKECQATQNHEIVASVSENKNSIIQNKECQISNGVAKTLELEETNSAEDGEIVNRNLSDGEISERSIAEQSIETEVVCISDEESKSKKKKKKDKKSKKSKKSDFRESADQNFYKIQTTDNIEAKSAVVHKSNIKEILDTDESIDDVFEYLELSDDSSCFEVEGISILSKEPTAKEILALSAKIDDIKREDVITEEEIREYERLEQERNEFEEVENISWKDRYLESKKVKSVLSTANILNAMRKKNKKLKKHIEETKNHLLEVTTETPLLARNDQLIEGSIQHYNTLQGSTKFVDPVKEDKVVTEKVSKEMEKDAKQLLKMYKKLLKYNNMNKKKDPNKKRKKNKEKHKDKTIS
ncbi:unnamed protein product [Pieris brassicae]|uniref:Uncharacterized protein n=1 Tax=Pieris brassicae TaxID=7116 RepID=A0A9P0TQH8_PIEBR|nr:unnamed protein product [Pieris brassicae]